MHLNQDYTVLTYIYYFTAFILLNIIYLSFCFKKENIHFWNHMTQIEKLHLEYCNSYFSFHNSILWFICTVCCTMCNIIYISRIKKQMDKTEEWTHIEEKSVSQFIWIFFCCYIFLIKLMVARQLWKGYMECIYCCTRHWCFWLQ